MQQVLVLNASYEPLNVCSLRRAHVLVFKGKAEVVEELDRPLRSATDTFQWPHVIRLVHYVRVPRIVQRKISRRALFARDNWRCVYCGTAGGRLTLDHVIPRSKGGDSTWENVVTSCAPCNLRKGNRLPHEVHMVLPARPRPPAPVLFIRLATPKIPQRWEQYLGAVRDLHRDRGLGSDRGRALDRQSRILLPLRPRARVEAAGAAREVKAMQGDARRDAGAAIRDQLPLR